MVSVTSENFVTPRTKSFHHPLSLLLLPQFTRKTTIEVEGLHLLVVPSTAVRYDEQRERRERNEAKQKRLQRTEDAKRLQEQAKEDRESNAGGGDREGRENVPD